MTSKAQAIQLTKDNLHRIFGETDEKKRLEAIASIWVPSSDLLFVDPLGVFKTHQGISDMVAKLQELGPGQVFSERGEVDVLQPDEEQDLWVTKVKWGVGPPGGALLLTGEDVLTIVGGKIKALYTFLDTK
ncbi:hypothetical protein B0J11DRAFT_290328 [Dendryphion nanum]|uniref:SnoaL-like domain-containing protein n=1 Tax=Dendryphion nanum TaxID=256645 RepID=A0A9P9IPW9_9PLEO|nr:hypothetical protein B0J11DRAFT_290328 [Dendryphion nanum]